MNISESVRQLPIDLAKAKDEAVLKILSEQFGNDNVEESIKKTRIIDYRRPEDIGCWYVAVLVDEQYLGGLEIRIAGLRWSVQHVSLAGFEDTMDRMAFSSAQ